MDDKLRSVLGNPELMAQIAAAVKGASGGEAPPQGYERREPPSAPVSTFSAEVPADKALALLTALRPFLSSKRQAKLETVTKAVAVANIYKNTKNI